MEPTAPRLGTLGRLHRLLRSNWITSTGAALMTLAVLGFATLIAMHVMGGAWSGPYVGIIATVVAPVVFGLGLVLVPVGLFLYRRRLAERLAQLSDRPLYLARAVVALTAVNFAAVGTVGYTGVHYMSSIEFCGKACHAVMEPEYVAFQRSPHSRVECVKCHVEPGAQGFIESKLNGTKQLLGVIFDDYRRPIPTPVHNLADARVTCEQCHWPEKYLGTKLKVKPHFRTDEAVSGYTNVLLMRTGGTRPDGAAVGIHWHTHPEATIEYVATDAQRTQIPWLRVVKPDGTREVFAAPGVAHDPPPPGELRRMDCNDCHNRSAHAFELPGDALDVSIAHGLLPRELPFFKQRALAALEADWTRANAADGIRQHLQAAYAKDGGIDELRRRKLEGAIEEVVRIWQRNVWPERKLGWNAYPDLATHFGCFRCHDGQHRSPQGRAVFGPTLMPDGAPIRDGSCDKCHVVLSENEEDPAVLDAFGLKR
ncbi:MAG: NapC/NirT family cytochrome c [Planctomycetes bacterium]|nr:NapC/NirT family cytochrome c [Planctomycetota bacterium]